LILFFFSDFIAVGIFHDAKLTIFFKSFSILIPLYLFTYIFLPLIRSFEEISWYSFIFNVLQKPSQGAFPGSTGPLWV